MKCCLAKYDESLNAVHELAEEIPPADSNLCVPMKNRFDFSVPEEFSVSPDCREEGESSGEIPLKPSDSPYFKFHNSFRNLLEKQYGHLSEDCLFGKMSDEGDDDVLLLKTFQKLEECSQLKEFQELFSIQFPEPEDSVLLCQLQKSFSDLFNEVKGDCSPEQFYKLIVDEVTNYCFYLIDSRTRTMKEFEQFEQEVHEKFTSYDFLKNPPLDSTKIKLASLLQEVDKLGKKYAAICNSNVEMRKLYQQQINLYKQILSLFKSQNWIETSSIEGCLDSKRNHSSYLHEHILRLKVLLSPLQEPYSVSTEGNRHTVKMVAGTISGALSALTKSGVHLKSGDEVRLCADAALYGDHNICSRDFEGVNIVCISPKLPCKKGGKLCIKTDGKSLESSHSTHYARSGNSGTEYDKAGKPGCDGENGRYGHAGGHILLVSQNLHHNDFDLSADGSPGEDGQNGGDGGAGWMPCRQGKDGSSPDFDSGWLKNGNAVVISYGTYGENGGPGGNAGMGGAPGKSGISGKIELLDLQNSENCSKTQPKVEDGKPGRPGKPGKGGKHTKHGKDCGAYAESARFGGRFLNFFSGSEQRSISSIRGELYHPNVEYLPGSGCQREAAAKGLPQQRKHENHPDFRDRGAHNSGKSTRVKLNTALADENKTIDKNACLQSMYQQCQQSLQHWNVKSHNQFLGTFAQKIGSANQIDSFVAFTHSEKIKASSAIWIARIQKQSEAMQTSVVQQSRQTVQAQVYMMKDFDEDTKHDDIGYLGSEDDCKNPVTLNLSPLKSVAAQRKMLLDGITLKSLLLTKDHDEMVEELVGLSRGRFVVVHCSSSKATKLHRAKYNYLIVKDKKDYRYEKRKIKDECILQLLNGITLKESEPLKIELDNIFYPLMKSWVQKNSGNHENSPLNLGQLHCIQQLKLVVALRKTYHIIGGKYVDSPKSYQAFQKLYAQYIDGMLISKSTESLNTLEQEILRDGLLITPLEISWITDETISHAEALHTSVKAYNQDPIVNNFLNVIAAFQKYHMAQITQPQKRRAYLSHLNTENCLSGLQGFYNQLCTALQIFFDKDQISDAFHMVPSVASSETILHHITLTGTNWEENQRDCQKTLALVCEQQQPAVYTVIDQFLGDVIERMEALMAINQPKHEKLLHPLDGLTFKETYIAFETLPSIQTAFQALSVYVKHMSQSVKSRDKLPHLLAYVYDIIHVYMSKFHPQTALSDYVKLLSEVGLKPDELRKSVQQISEFTREKNTKIEALLDLLKKFHSLTALEATDCDDLLNNTCLLGRDELLMRVPGRLQELLEFCRKIEVIAVDDKLQRAKIIAGRNKAVSEWTKAVAAILKTLRHYPMSCPISALYTWKLKMETIMVLVRKKIRKFDPILDDNFTDLGEEIDGLDGDDIGKRLYSLKNTLKESASSCGSLADLRTDLRWTKYADNLDQYTALHQADDNGRAKILIQKTLALEENFQASPCLDTLSHWLGPGLMTSLPHHITVVTQRLKPGHDVFILAQKPNEYQETAKPTLTIFPDSDSWQSYERDHTSSDAIPQFREVSDKVITEMLGSDIREKLKKEGSLVLSEELKAKLLAGLGYEEEFTVQHDTWCDDQVLVYRNASFSLLAINMKTGQVITHRSSKITSIKDEIDENCIIIVQCQCSSKVSKAVKELKVLKLSTEQLSIIQGASGEGGMCLVKHPGQPVVMDTVSKCGDSVEHNFSYTKPLLTNLLYSDGIRSYSEQFQPLSDLLNRYCKFYQSLLQMDTLDSAIKASLKKYTTTLFQTDVPELVKAVRHHFIQECVVSTIHSNESQNIQIMQQSIEEMFKPPYDSPVLEDMYLTGLESFVYFLLAKSSEFKIAQQFRLTKGTRNIHYQFWRQLLKEESLTPQKAKCLCLAFAYLDRPEGIDDSLESQRVLSRYEIYNRIATGLHLLKSHQDDVYPKKDPISIITQLHQQVLAYQEVYPLEALEEASMDFKDKRNIGSLLEIVKSVVTLREELLRRLQDEHLPTMEACSLLLNDPHFYNDLHGIMLSWCFHQQQNLLSNVQHIISDPLFIHYPQKEKLINVMSSWLLDRTDLALSEHNWKDLANLYLIGELLSAFMSDLLTLIREQLLETSVVVKYPDLMSNLLTIVQVIDASLDIASVVTVMQMTPSAHWLKHLLVHNFLEAYTQEHFDVISIDGIRDKLLNIDPKLLQIFYNVFIADQCQESENKDSTIGLVSEAELDRILDWLPFIEPSPDAYSSLCRTSLSMWERKLTEIHFKQYLDHWHGLTEADKKRTVFLMNRVRLDSGITHSDFMSMLFMIRDKYISSESKESYHLLALFEDLYYKRFTLQKASNIIHGHEYKDWSEQFNKLKAEDHIQCQPRSVQEILDLIDMQIKSHIYQKNEKEFLLIRKEASQITSQLAEFDKSKLSPSITVFFQTLQRHITVDQKLQWFADNHVEFVVNLIKVWMLVTSRSGRIQIPYNTQIVSLLLFLHTDNQGLLQQVKTGEGKTMVVGMLAAAKALLGFHVDVVSSNRDLAEDGVRKCQDFFHALGLKAAANCTDDDDTNQQAYKSHIVYGDVGSFQRDVLTEETNPDGTDFSARYSDMRKNCLLVDEVDSMFLDKGRHMLYISHQSPALKHLESLFLMIWSSVLSIDPEKMLIDAMLDQMTEDLIALIENKTISVPYYLTSFCRHKMRAWVRSAYQARCMDANDQFIIDNKGEEDANQPKQIFPIDKQTGIEQYNMKWSNGLSQFLELKYRRTLSSESLKAVFISNKRFFKRYGKALYGLTGTLGSVSSRKLLKDVYSISTVEMPTNKAKRYTQQKSRVAADNKEWCEEISKEINKNCTEQPILVICENIKQLNNIKEHLVSPEASNELQIIDYARDGDDIEEPFENQGGALPGQVVLATNKGGRGTDIKIKEEIVPKGLHVIVSFLPDNTRIEEQAFGRAARAGQPGSGSLVLQVNPDSYQSEIEVFETIEAATETLIEMEKIKREEAESDRINLLLSEGIPQLDLEENLYESFQRHRRVFESTLKGATFLGEEITEATKKSCIAVETDRWAYWLDSVHDKVRAADSFEKRKALMNEFDKEFPCHGLPHPSSSPDSIFFMTPEHCIQLGQAYMEKANFGSALSCFERAITRGDLTGVAAMSACYCYVKSHSRASKENKKCARRYLKKAKSQLDVLRQGWMANGEVGKSLGDLVDVSQFVDGGENSYAEQIEEKIKVIGLHLNTLDSLLGSTVDQYSFVNGSKLEVEKLTEDDSKAIYQKLADHDIICHHKVRKCWKRRDKLEPFIKDTVESRIADGLISLILEHTTITERDLNCLVYSSDELWQLLDSLFEPAGTLLKVGKVDEAKLPEDTVRKSWQELKAKFSDLLGGGSNPAELVLSTDDPILLTLQEKAYESLTTHLKSSGLYCQRALIKDDACSQVMKLDLGKYKQCMIRDEEGTSEQCLCDFLIALFTYCHGHEKGYCYEQFLPFDCQIAEARKLHVFLQQHDILKSGSLSLHDCNSEGQFISAVEKALCKDYTKEQLTFILNIVRESYGKLRGFKEGSVMKIGFIDFYNLKDRPQDIPKALDFFTTWHLDYFLTLEEDENKSWWDWNAFAVAMIGLAQVIAGAALITLTAGLASSIGSGLIAEGINDMVYATMAGITGTFSWKDWAIQKAISVAIAIATGGIGAMAATLKVASKVGSASRLCKFVKTLAKAAGEFALNLTTCIISDIFLADLQERVVNSIVDKVEKELFSTVTESLHSQLMKMAAQESSDDNFHTRCKAIKHDFERTLALDPTLPEEFDQLRSQIVSCLRDNYKAMADNLSKSQSKWAKLVGKGAKAAMMADDLCTAVDLGLRTFHAVKAMTDIVIIGDCKPAQRSQSKVDEALVQRELDEIKDIFRTYIRNQIQQKLKGVLKSIIKGSLKKVARAGKKIVTQTMKSALHGKTTSEVVKDISDKRKEKKKSAVMSADFDDEPPDDGPPKPKTPAQEKQIAYQQMRKSFEDTILKPKRKVPSEEEIKEMKCTLQAADCKLPKEHLHHSDNLATGYSRNRGPELERMPQRRADSVIQLPENARLEQIRPRKRALSNYPQEERPETRQPPSHTSRSHHDDHIGKLSDFNLGGPLYHGTKSKADAVKLLHIGASSEHSADISADIKRPGQLGKANSRSVAENYAGPDPSQGYVLKVSHPNSENLRGIHYSPPGKKPYGIQRHHESEDADIKASKHFDPDPKLSNSKSAQVCFRPEEVKWLQFKIDPNMPEARKKNLLETVDRIMKPRSFGSSDLNLTTLHRSLTKPLAIMKKHDEL